MADKTVDLNADADADAKDLEFIGISEAVTETDNSMPIGQGQPKGATDASATFTNFQSVEEVIKFYKLPIKNLGEQVVKHRMKILVLLRLIQRLHQMRLQLTRND